jgi:hypothetical protein
MENFMDWTQAITIIGSVIVPMMGGFGWIIHRMDTKFDKADQRMNAIEHRINNIENRLTALEMRVGFIERLFEMMRFPNKTKNIEVTDP